VKASPNHFRAGDWREVQSLVNRMHQEGLSLVAVLAREFGIEVTVLPRELSIENDGPLT
jgi:hypothetical protein